MLFAVNILFDYAKIRAVVEDRRSMIGALAAALRFIRRHPGAGVGALPAEHAGVPASCWPLFRDRAGRGAPTWAAPAIGQLYIVARIIVRLQFAASQTALFQGRLAHAGYMARPVPKWPDSPAAEAIGPQ